MRPHRIRRNIQSTLPTGGHTGNAAHGDKRECHNAAITAKRMRAVIGDGAQKQIRRLIAIVDMLCQVIIDSTSAIELIFEAINDMLGQLLQIRRECNVRTVLGNIFGQRRVQTRMRRKRTPIDIVISGIDLITIGH